MVLNATKTHLSDILSYFLVEKIFGTVFEIKQVQITKIENLKIK